MALFKKQTTDPLSVAHGKVAAALDVFTVASSGLQEAVQHFHAVEEEAKAAIAKAAARVEEAVAAREKSSKVISKIESLLA